MMIWKENFQSKPWNRGKSFFSPPRRGSTHLTLATHLRMVLAHYFAQFWWKTITKNYENTQKSRTEVNSAVRMDDYERGCSLNSRFPQSGQRREKPERGTAKREKLTVVIPFWYSMELNGHSFDGLTYGSYPEYPTYRVIGISRFMLMPTVLLYSIHAQKEF